MPPKATPFPKLRTNVFQILTLINAPLHEYINNLKLMETQATALIESASDLDNQGSHEDMIRHVKHISIALGVLDKEYNDWHGWLSGATAEAMSLCPP
jgi:hypothetical protein